jgi:hypothetical protein
MSITNPEMLLIGVLLGIILGITGVGMLFSPFYLRLPCEVVFGLACGLWFKLIELVERSNLMVWIPMGVMFVVMMIVMMPLDLLFTMKLLEFIVASIVATLTFFLVPNNELENAVDWLLSARTNTK